MRNGLVALGLGIALTLSTSMVVGAQEGGPPDSIEIAPGVTAEGLAFAAGQTVPSLYRLVVAPSVTYDVAPDASLALALVESGTITVSFDRAFTVSAAADGSAPADQVDAGQEAMIEAGGYLALPAMAAGVLRNDGPVPASLLVASIAVGAARPVPDASAAPAAPASPSGSPGAMTGFVGAVDAKAGASCLLEYQRADSPWAATGKPDGALGTETITLLPGLTQTFLTDWKYEKLRNNGSTYYGSHLRRTLNRSNRTIRIRVKASGVTFWDTLEPGTWDEWRLDLMAVACP